MGDLEVFNKAADDVKNLNKTPADNELLELYSLYKQATVGDCNTGNSKVAIPVGWDKPGFLDFKGKAKWEAWNSRKGMTTNEAQTAYITLVNKLVGSHGLKP